MSINVPGLWYTSLYDIALAPNLELYNLVRKTAKGEAANQQWLIIAPVGHCAFNGSTSRPLSASATWATPGSTIRRSCTASSTYAQRRTRPTMEKPAQSALLHDGQQQVELVGVWPPKGATPVTYYLSSGGKANTLERRRPLTLTRRRPRRPDRFTYDPMDPVPTLGGYRVGSDPEGRGGSFDQRKIEERRGRARLHERAVHGRHRGRRPDHADPLRLLGRQGHRHHRQDRRRLSRRPGVQPGRVDPAPALSRRLRQAPGVDGARTRSTR